MMKIILTILILVALLTGIVLGIKWLPVWQAKNYEELLQALYKNTVPLMEASKVRTIQAVLIDVRSAEEYAVSHLKGAIAIDYNTPDLKLMDAVSKQDTIVVYCSVGYRSEKFGEQLIEMGFENVHNLYGGIFEWANKGHEIVDKNQQPTKQVHSYSKSWSKWLNSDIKAIF